MKDLGKIPNNFNTKATSIYYLSPINWFVNADSGYFYNDKNKTSITFYYISKSMKDYLNGKYILLKQDDFNRFCKVFDFKIE